MKYGRISFIKWKAIINFGGNEGKSFYSNKGDFHMNALFSIKLVSKGLGKIAYRKFNKTKWEGMCNIKMKRCRGFA